ncbi:MAG: DNA-binding NarL/FixJ family response regulator [Arenicella sp.]|jgi:DNA-binding NarL/FixJ family response regulator
MKIALVDDQSLILEGLKLLLIKEIPKCNVTAFSSSTDFLDNYKDKNYDLIITDIEIPEINGIELIIKIRAKNPKQKILVLSMYKNKVLLQSLFELKINGFLCKVNSTNELINAIHTIDMDENYISPEVAHLIGLSKDQNNNVLTKREIQIVQSVIKGLNNKKISSLMFISEHTVKTHRKNILYKLNLSSSFELVKYAIENNIS